MKEGTRLYINITNTSKKKKIKMLYMKWYFTTTEIFVEAGLIMKKYYCHTNSSDKKKEPIREFLIFFATRQIPYQSSRLHELTTPLPPTKNHYY